MTNIVPISDLKNYTEVLSHCDNGSTVYLTTIAHRYEPEMLIFGDVFVLTYKTAEV